MTFLHVPIIHNDCNYMCYHLLGTNSINIFSHLKERGGGGSFILIAFKMPYLTLYHSVNLKLYIGDILGIIQLYK